MGYSGDVIPKPKVPRRALYVVLVLLAPIVSSCSSQQDSTSSSQSKISTISTTVLPPPTTLLATGPTWTTAIPTDVFDAPFAQAVCDSLRTWKPPALTSADDVELLRKATKKLQSMIEVSKSTTYVQIFVGASAALEYEANFPNDEVFPFTFQLADGECIRLGFTEENSKYGIDPRTGNLKGE